ncbi:MAG: class I SAM-dependent methyltransferase [Bdellovibrionales bacterium]|nr:class I SAM-dependent methyltransferase [Bdellovibrionales bacterium]
MNAFRNQYPRLLEKELVAAGLDSVLDVGCGSSSPIRSFSKKIPLTVGADGFLPSIEKSQAQGIHQKYVQVDFRNLENYFQEKSFDAVIALDVIEHFEKPEAIALIQKLEKIAKKKVVLFTPHGFLKQGVYDQNQFQLHRCGFDVSELKKMGYRVLGVHGLKPFRGEYADIRFKPKKFWTLVSWLTQPFAQVFPKTAFQLLAIKEFPATEAGALK